MTPRWPGQVVTRENRPMGTGRVYILARECSYVRIEAWDYSKVRLGLHGTTSIAINQQAEYDDRFLDLGSRDSESPVRWVTGPGSMLGILALGFEYYPCKVHDTRPMV